MDGGKVDGGITMGFFMGLDFFGSYHKPKENQKINERS